MSTRPVLGFALKGVVEHFAVIAAADRIGEHPLRFNVDGARHRQRRAAGAVGAQELFADAKIDQRSIGPDLGDLIRQGGEIARDQIDDGPIAEHRQQEIVEYLPHHIGGASLSAMMCVRR